MRDPNPYIDQAPQVVAGALTCKLSEPNCAFAIKSEKKRFLMCIWSEISRRLIFLTVSSLVCTHQ